MKIEAGLSVLDQIANELYDEGRYTQARQVWLAMNEIAISRRSWWKAPLRRIRNLDLRYHQHIIDDGRVS